VFELLAEDEIPAVRIPDADRITLVEHSAGAGFSAMVQRAAIK
jgi:hypothetical protein